MLYILNLHYYASITLGGKKSQKKRKTCLHEDSPLDHFLCIHTCVCVCVCVVKFQILWDVSSYPEIF